jgi:hypothetical protein
MTPSLTLWRHLDDARKAVTKAGIDTHNEQDKQRWLRRVHVELHRRLKAAGIHVEGA